MFDECYKKERFELYEYWISIGMAIKNTFLNEDEAFELFNYYSSKFIFMRLKIINQNLLK